MIAGKSATTKLQSPSCARGMLATVASVLLLAFAVPDTAKAANLTARGNEPGWRIEISDKSLDFHGLDGETFTLEPVPRSVTADGVDTYSATVEGRLFVLAIADKLCVDTMSGMPFPKMATAVVGDRTLAGCAGEPAELLHGDWQVSEIVGWSCPYLTGQSTIEFLPG